MKIINKLKSFIDGCFDFENPLAGCCKSIGTIPDIQKEYKRTYEKDDDNNQNKGDTV